MSYSDDLDWLAMNVHEWPSGENQSWCYVGRDYLSGDMRAAGHTIRMVQPGLVRRDDWLARRAELQAKAEPHPFIGLDEAIRKVLSVMRTEPEAFTPKELSEMKDICDAELAKLDTLENRPADLSEPAVTERLAEATQNVLAAIPQLKSEKFKFDLDEAVCPACGCKGIHACLGKPVAVASTGDTTWYERGELPPVGTKCMYLSANHKIYKVEITAHAKLGICFIEPGKDGENYTRKNPEDFLPICTERDELIEIILSCNMSEGVLADAILAAGFKRGEV